MKRDLIFIKNVTLANVLLETGKCVNEGNWVFSCNDSIKDMKILQQACTNFLKKTPYKNYRICFANSDNYYDFITV